MDVSKLVTDAAKDAVDPNELLRRAKAAAEQTMADLDDPETAEEVTANEADLATAVLQLDDWLTRGGFLPTAWQYSND